MIEYNGLRASFLLLLTLTLALYLFVTWKLAGLAGRVSTRILSNAASLAIMVPLSGAVASAASKDESLGLGAYMASMMVSAMLIIGSASIDLLLYKLKKPGSSIKSNGAEAI